MGCATSKQHQKRCCHCQSPYAPPVVTRSYSVHVHHPPQSKDDSYHLVALTSTTLGSLKLDSSDDTDKDKVKVNDKDKDFSLGLIEAKTWSAMIDQRIPKLGPKTPIRTPPGEPETINAWELMEGLEDSSPFRSPIHLRSFSFDVVRDPIAVQPKEFNSPEKKSMWLQNSTEEEEEEDCSNNSSDSVIIDPEFECRKSKSEKQKLILYFTSLRGVRKTYEDCCHVRVILKSLGVRADERDVSMHSGFRDELKIRIAGAGGGLPRVFVGEEYVGGADEIRRLNEEGKLEKLLDGCEQLDDVMVGDKNSISCEACGDIRFVPCDTCSGSCKVYYEQEDDDEEEVEENCNSEDDFGFQRCPDCNENGLIRCPICCY